MSDEKFTILDIQKVIMRLKERFLYLTQPLNFFFKCPIRELSNEHLKGATIDLIKKLGTIEHTVGVDFFYYRDTVFNDSFKMFPQLTKLRELILFPVLSPTKLLKELQSVNIFTLESLQLGIMNISVPELR